MICKQHEHNMPKVETEHQLMFNDNGKIDQEDNEEVVPPAGGGEVRPWIKCNKCNKRGHYTNKCHWDKIDQEVSAFGIEGSNNKGYCGSNNNVFIYLTVQHRGVNYNWLLIGNQSTINIMCSRRHHPDELHMQHAMIWRIVVLQKRCHEHPVTGKSKEEIPDHL
eukprot:2269403-Ditylum_brightwellii.AAC.1